MRTSLNRGGSGKVSGTSFHQEHRQEVRYQTWIPHECAELTVAPFVPRRKYRSSEGRSILSSPSWSKCWWHHFLKLHPLQPHNVWLLQRRYLSFPPFLVFPPLLISNLGGIIVLINHFSVYCFTVIIHKLVKNSVNMDSPVAFMETSVRQGVWARLIIFRPINHIVEFHLKRDPNTTATDIKGTQIKQSNSSVPITSL